MATDHLTPITAKPTRRGNGILRIIMAFFIPLVLLMGGCVTLGVVVSRNLCLGFHSGPNAPPVLIAPGVVVLLPDHGIRITDGKTLWQDDHLEVDTLASDGSVGYYHHVAYNSNAPLVDALMARRLSNGSVVWQQSLVDYTNVLQLTLNKDTLFSLLSNYDTNTWLKESGISAWRLSDGQLLWHTSPPTIPVTNLHTNHLALAGSLIMYWDESTVYGMDVATGKLRWQFHNADAANVIDHVTAGVNDTIIVGEGPYVNSSTPPQRHLVDIATATGTQRWQANLAHRTDFVPVLSDSRVYMMDGPTLAAHRLSDGVTIWQAALGVADGFTSVADLGKSVVVVGVLGENYSATDTAALFALDEATGQINNQAQIVHSGNFRNPIPLDSSGNGGIWLNKNRNTVAIYDPHTLQPTAQHTQPLSSNAVSTIATVQGGKGFVTYGDVTTGHCPVRHTAGLAELAADDAHTLWSETYTLSY